MDLQLQGRACLVTGGSSGIGFGAARMFAAEGCRVAIAARNKDDLERAADRVVQDGNPRPLTIAQDITADGAASSIRDEVTRYFGALDVLVNAAGFGGYLAWDAADEDHSAGMTMNYVAARRLSVAFISGMIAQQYGRIINLTGTSEPLHPTAVSPAKAAVHAWQKGVSRTLAKEGITVNSVAPGIINSRQVSRLFASEAERAAATELIPMGRIGDPEDIAPLILFLASPLARYITGTVIHVDGGMRRFAF